MNLLDLMVKINVDDQASAKVKGVSSSIKTGLADAAKTAAKVTAAAVTAAAAGAVAFSKMAIGSYAQYEQLAGGVDKLFGEASGAVKQYAQDAYLTTGQSANQYMEQVTSFSAALINSLGGDTAAAAAQADVAMRAISDNVNTFGSDVESVQMAFQGFAKQNYTMLDNLKLGYGGTKSEMERLIADANEYAAANQLAGDLSVESFSDIVTAIEYIQEKQGIAGTTQKEAMKTIEGSIKATKSAFANFVTELGKNDGDVRKRFTELVKVGTVAFEQVSDRLLTIVTNISDAMPEIIPLAAQAIEKNLPKIISAVTKLLPMMLQVLVSIAKAIIQSIPQMVSEIVPAIIEMFPVILEAGFEMFLALVDALTQAIPQIINALPQLIQQVSAAIVKYMPQILEAGMKLFLTLVTAVIQAVPDIVHAIIFDLIPAIVNGLLSGLMKMAEAAGKFIGTFIDGILAGKDPARAAADALAAAAGSGIESQNLYNRAMRQGDNLVQGLVNGINSSSWRLYGQCRNLADNCMNMLSNVMQIFSPSRRTRWMGEMLVEGLAEGIEDVQGLAVDAAGNMAEAVSRASEVDIEQPSFSAPFADADKAVSSGGVMGELAVMLEDARQFQDFREFLEDFLPRTIADYTPYQGKYDFDRAVRKAVA